MTTHSDVPEFNCALAWTSFPVSVIKPFVPFYMVRSGEPFNAKTVWKGAISGIRALQRLKKSVGNKSQLKSDMVIVSGHHKGHLLLWNADRFAVMNKSQHFNNVNVTDCIVTLSYVYTIVEKGPKGKHGDDTDVYVWDLNAFDLRHTLQGHDERVMTIAVNEKDENMSVSGGIDRTICVWNLRSLPNPVARLTGHTMMVTKVIFFGTDMIISGSNDSTIRMWDIPSASQTSIHEGHGGPICFLNFNYTIGKHTLPFSAQSPTKTPTKPSSPRVSGFTPAGAELHSEVVASPKNLPTPKTSENGLVTACAGGIIREWRFDGRGLQQKWFNKAHKALITDITLDGDICISGCAADGVVTFFNSSTKVSARASVSDHGIRRLACDSSRKICLGGSDMGHVVLWNYSNIANNIGDEPSPVLLAVLQPHLTGVSGLILERDANGQWERVVTCSIDHSMFVMDFNLTRDSKVFPGLSTSHLCPITQTGTIVTESPNDHTGVLWDVRDMQAKQGRTSVLTGHTAKVTGQRYSAEHRRLLTASTDGTLRMFDVMLYDEEEMKHEEVVEASGVIEMQAPLCCLSQPKESLIVVGTQKGRHGSLVVVDFVNGTTVGPPIALNVYPVHVHLLVWFEKEGTARKYAIVAQLRNGEVHLYRDASEGNSMRPLLSQQHFVTDDSTPEDAPLKCRLNEKYSPPRIEVLLVEDRTLVRDFEIGSASHETSTSSLFAARMDGTVVRLAAILQGTMHTAAALDSGLTVVLDKRGEVLFEIEADGHTVNKMEVRPSRRRRSFVTTEAEPTEAAVELKRRSMPRCTALAVCTTARYLCVGYASGVVLTWDTVHKNVTRRIQNFTVPVSEIWILPDQQRLVSSCAEGMRIDSLYNRDVRDSETVVTVDDDAIMRLQD